MGYTQHHCIIITTYSIKYQKRLQKFLRGNSVLHLKPHTSQINGWITTIIPSNGSKAGWPEAQADDEVRQCVRDWLSTPLCWEGEGFNPYQWVEVAYGEFIGGEDNGAMVVDHYGNYPQESEE